MFPGAPKPKDRCWTQTYEDQRPDIKYSGVLPVCGFRAGFPSSGIAVHNFQYQVSVHQLNDKANDNTWNTSSGRQITVSVAPETGSSYNFRQEQDIFWFSKTTRMCSRSQKVRLRLRLGIVENNRHSLWNRADNLLLTDFKTTSGFSRHLGFTHAGPCL